MQRARCYLLGEAAVVLELEPPVTLESQRRIWGLTERLAGHADVREAIPGMNNLTLLLRNPQQTALDVLERLQCWWEESDQLIPAARSVAIPVIYGGEHGPDLSWVAGHTGLSERGVVECHAGATYTLYFLGFQPGFPYLAGLPDSLVSPRRSQPRLAVPAGSVGIGGSQTGVYPLATPGGWQIIGRTPLSMFNPTKQPPTRLLPGDTVRFVPQPEGVC